MTVLYIVISGFADSVFGASSLYSEKNVCFKEKTQFKGLKIYGVLSLFSVPPAILWDTTSIGTGPFHPNPSKFITNYSFYHSAL
jgi:hypothetical protein